jgi:hypothetical protein
LYVDVQTFQLFNKRTTLAGSGVDPWGRYLFIIPVTYQTRLKWFASSAPTNDIGTDGDYCLLWGGYPSYGLQPSIFGPKAAGAWPGAAALVAVTLNPLYTAEDQHSI